MTHSTSLMATAAAVLMVTAGVASAQTALKAEVPFAFHVGSKVMEPGTIRVQPLNGHTGIGGVLVNNHAAKRSYIVLPEFTGDAPKTWAASGAARLSFDCRTGACILVQFWSGEGYAYTFRRPKIRGGEMQLTEIVMKADKAE